MLRARDLPPLLVRADAGAGIGAGHLMRSLALAAAWRARGGHVHLVSCRPEARLRARYAAVGAEIEELTEAYPSGSDLTAMLAVIKRARTTLRQPPWVVVDGYGFDTPYQTGLRAAGSRVVVIDDNNHLPFYNADIVVNHGIHARQLTYAYPRGATLLCGSRYALLRPEFQERARKAKTIAEHARKLLITLGASDPVNATAKAIKALRRLPAADVHARVVAGPLNRRIDDLKSLAAKASCRIDIETNVRRISSVMCWADVALTAAGGTCWELAALGVPMITAVVAPNQQAIATALANSIGAVNLGWHDQFTIEQMRQAIVSLMQDSARRGVMSRKARAMVDGQGAYRVVHAMLGKRFSEAA